MGRVSAPRSKGPEIDPSAGYFYLVQPYQVQYYKYSITGRISTFFFFFYCIYVYFNLPTSRQYIYHEQIVLIKYAALRQFAYINFIFTTQVLSNGFFIK